VLDSAKGWAACIRFSARVRAQFEAFLAREDTFSLGVCNGCQLMALLGWVPYPAARGKAAPAASGAAVAAAAGGASPEDASLPLSDARQPRFVRNASRR